MTTADGTAPVTGRRTAPPHRRMACLRRLHSVPRVANALEHAEPCGVKGGEIFH